MFWIVRNKDYISNEFNQILEYSIINEDYFYKHSIPKHGFYVHIFHL